MLRHHFHPSVQAFANSFITSPHQIKFDGDPTLEFNVKSFLNRFAYKNPKKSVENETAKPKKTKDVNREEPLNAKSFLRLKSHDVAPDKQFFYKYFNERENLRQSGRSKRGVIR
jgi:hypothetical protein